MSAIHIHRALTDPLCTRPARGQISKYGFTVSSSVIIFWSTQSTCGPPSASAAALPALPSSSSSLWLYSPCVCTHVCTCVYICGNMCVCVCTGAEMVNNNKVWFVAMKCSVTIRSRRGKQLRHPCKCVHLHIAKTRQTTIRSFVTKCTFTLRARRVE